MRWLGLSLMTLCTFMVGCEQPMESGDTIPSLPSSATTDEVMSEESAPPVEAPAVEGSAAETPTESAPTEVPAAEPPKPDSAARVTDKVRFVADTSLKVPTMMCPFSCWPKVQETLAAQPGVEAVQLAEQAKEGEINNPVVELKIKSGFDSAAAIAALKKASFENAEVIN